MRIDRNSYLFGLVFFVVLLPSGTVRAQSLPAPLPTPVASPTPSLEKQFFKNVLRDQKAIWTAPLHLERSDAKWIVPSILGTGALITTDRITGDEIAESRDWSKPSEILSDPGSIYAALGTSAVFYTFGRLKDNSRARETGILTAEASLDSLIVVSALKGITQRVRPADGIDRSEFFDGGSSFPSGHSAEAWALATVISNEYHDHRAVQIAAYGTAAAVSVARFTGGKHYLSDALVGSALGFGIGQYVYNAHHHKESDSDDNDSENRISHWPSIAAHFNRHARQYGIGLQWNF